jgi:hypothetical protein
MKIFMHKNQTNKKVSEKKTKLGKYLKLKIKYVF